MHLSSKCQNRPKRAQDCNYVDSDDGADGGDGDNVVITTIMVNITIVLSALSLFTKLVVT